MSALDFFVYGRIQMYDVSRLSLCYAWLSMFTFVFMQAALSSSRSTSSLRFTPQRSRRVLSVLDTRGSEDEDEVQLGASNAAKALSKRWSSSAARMPPAAPIATRCAMRRSGESRASACTLQASKTNRAAVLRATCTTSASGVLARQAMRDKGLCATCGCVCCVVSFGR
jgi:hypothetical protein